MAEAVRAGRPQVVCPVGFDQPMWADRLHHLGVAAPPLPARELSVARLGKALRQATHPAIHKAAKALQQALETPRTGAASGDSSSGWSAGTAVAASHIVKEVQRVVLSLKAA